MSQGKIFEQIVSLIEHSLKSDENVTVKHDVKLVDSLGIERQIDVYITAFINEHEITVAIECKDHNSKVKITEIDAFDSKTRKLAVDKRIFVSKNGYQSGAIKTAKKTGIELCTLSNLSKEVLKSWLQIPGLQMINQIYDFKHSRFNLAKETTVKKLPPNYDIESNLYLADKKKQISTSEVRQNLINQLSKQHPDFFEPNKTKKVVFNFPKEPYYLKINNLFERIDNIESIIFFRSEITNHPISYIQQYSQINGKNIAKAASIEFPALSQEFILSFVRSESDNLTRVVIAPKKK
ncbi:MAG: restriction endonuclease [Candidatus Woesebacteria bacterium]|jgi:hypothetical protein